MSMFAAMSVNCRWQSRQRCCWRCKRRRGWAVKLVWNVDILSFLLNHGSVEVCMVHAYILYFYCLYIWFLCGIFWAQASSFLCWQHMNVGSGRFVFDAWALSWLSFSGLHHPAASVHSLWEHVHQTPHAMCPAFRVQMRSLSARLSGSCWCVAGSLAFGDLIPRRCSTGAPGAARWLLWPCSRFPLLHAVSLGCFLLLVRLSLPSLWCCMLVSNGLLVGASLADVAVTVRD
jgi:hypothetical protein